MNDISHEVLEKLRSVDTPTICNIIELFDVRPRNTGYMDARIKAFFPEMPPMVGFAATATFRASGPPQPGKASYVDSMGQIERFGELSGPPVVVFQDLDDPSEAATFGEVMCTVYQAFGATGLVTSGTGRDFDQVQAIDFPIFASGACCAHGYCHTLQLYVPVHVGGITVNPDDLIHGDRNGVTTIPHDIASEVADVSDAFMAAETCIFDAMRDGSPTRERLQEAFVECGAQIQAVRQQVSRSNRS